MGLGMQSVTDLTETNGCGTLPLAQRGRSYASDHDIIAIIFISMPFDHAQLDLEGANITLKCTDHGHFDSRTLLTNKVAPLDINTDIIINIFIESVPLQKEMYWFI